MLDMRVFVNVVDTLCIEKRRAAFNAVNLISLLEEKFCEVRPVLASQACNECFLNLSNPFDLECNARLVLVPNTVKSQ